MAKLHMKALLLALALVVAGCVTAEANHVNLNRTLGGPGNDIPVGLALFGASGPPDLILAGTTTNAENFAGASAGGGSDGGLGGDDGWVTRRSNLTLGLAWTSVFGTPGDDTVTAMVATSDAVIVAGHTTGDLDSQPNAGASDAFLRAFSIDDGTHMWTTLFGTGNGDYAHGLALDEASGDLFVVGSTAGNFHGSSATPGGDDAFIARLNAIGLVQWVRQYGSNGTDVATCAAVSGNTVYVGGWGAAGASLGDATVTKFDLDGALFWRRSVVSTSGSEVVTAITVLSGGDVLSVGETTGLVPSFGAADDPNGRDAFAVRTDEDGNHVAGLQVGGSGNERCSGSVVALLDGDVAVMGGWTDSADWAGEALGGTDFWVMSMDVSGGDLAVGNLTRSGTDADDTLDALAADANCRRVFAAGSTDADEFEGVDNRGGFDAYVTDLRSAFGVDGEACPTLLDGEPDGWLYGRIIPALAIYSLCVAVLASILIVVVCCSKSLPPMESNSEDSAEVDERIQELFATAAAGQNHTDGTITFNQAFVAVNTHIQKQMDFDDAEDIHEALGGGRLDAEDFREFFLRISSEEGVHDPIGVLWTIVAFFAFVFLPITLLFSGPWVADLRTKCLKFLGFTAKMRRAISNSRVTFWAIYGVVTFLWATIPFIIVIGFYVIRKTWGSWIALEDPVRRGYFTGPEAVVPGVTWLGICLVMTAYFGRAEKVLEKERVRLIQNMSSDERFVAHVHAVGATGAREAWASDSAAESGAGSRKKGKKTDKKVTSKAKDKKKKKTKSKKDSSTAFDSSSASTSSSGSSSVGGAESMGSRSASGFGSVYGGGEGPRIWTGTARDLIAYLYGGIDPPDSMGWRLYVVSTIFIPPLFMVSVGNGLRLAFGLNYFGTCVGSDGVPPPPLADVERVEYNCSPDHNGDLWSAVGTQVSSLVLYFLFAMILRFMSRTYEIYAEKLKATKRLVELIDDDVASDVELTLDRPSNVVCWSQARLFVHSFNSLQIRRLEVVAASLLFMMVIMAVIVIFSFVSPFAALDTYVLYGHALIAVATLLGYLVWPTLIMSIRINLTNDRVLPLLSGTDWTLHGLRNAAVDEEEAQRLDDSIRLVNALINQVTRFPAVFEVLHQPVTVARVTSLLGVAFTAIASLVISTVSRIVRQSTDGSASGIHED